ncbi:MAG: pyridoxal-dependent decarboxylase [Planctomycetota bacterium]|nr:pyridoxal-dependent decarboxylase [Planctomycetota bacterium]
MTELPPVFPSADLGHQKELQRILRRASDRVAQYLTSLSSRQIFPAKVQAPQDDLFPPFGVAMESVLDEAMDWAEANSIHVGSPGYVGHMDSGVAVAGIVGDYLASALNQNLLAYELAPGATLLEKELIQLFAKEAGLPDSAGGTFTTGGTSANLTALLQARNAYCRTASTKGMAQEMPLCILCSEDAHYSIAKSAAVLGIGSDHVVKVPVAGPERRLDPNALLGALKQAQQKGLRPIALVATAGTTSCGAIDPLSACADFCDEEGLWFHVDAAHGGALLLHATEKKRLHGIHRADSITLDPHKWLFAPKSTGILLVRQGEELVTAEYQAPYLDRFSTHRDALPLSQGRRSLDGSRRFDALKLWMILRHFGRNGLQKMLEDRLSLTRWFHQTLSENPYFAPSHLPDLNVQAFAPRQEKEAHEIAQAHLRVEQKGKVWPSYTLLGSKPCHRVVLINPSGTQDLLTQVLVELEEAHQQSHSALA